MCRGMRRSLLAYLCFSQVPGGFALVYASHLHTVVSSGAQLTGNIYSTIQSYDIIPTVLALPHIMYLKLSTNGTCNV